MKQQDSGPSPLPSLGERVPEVRGRVRGHCRRPASRPVWVLVLSTVILCCIPIPTQRSASYGRARPKLRDQRGTCCVAGSWARNLVASAASRTGSSIS